MQVFCCVQVFENIYYIISKIITRTISKMTRYLTRVVELSGRGTERKAAFLGLDHTI